MEKVRYMISDAAQIAGVETHVLRYWEEELDLTIPRNEMGHRYYTRENINDFLKIKELKEQGYQLKTIRNILHGMDLEEAKAREEKLTLVAKDQSLHTVPQRAMEQGLKTTPEVRMEQFKELMSDIIGTAIAQNNEELCLILGKEMKEGVIKEMNYLAREQDLAAEERYKKLDQALRGNARKHHFFSREKEEDKIAVKGIQKDLETKEKLSLTEKKKIQREKNKKKNAKAMKHSFSAT